MFEPSGDQAASQGDDGVGSGDGPEHARLFQALANHCLATGFDDARAYENPLSAEFCVAHGGGVVFEVVDLSPAEFSTLAAAGHEGLHALDQVVDLAVREKVDYVGLSFLAGDHMTLVRQVIRELKEQGADNVKLIIGGIIPKRQIPELQAMGVQQVFLPGTPLKQIENYIKQDSTSEKAQE